MDITMGALNRVIVDEKTKFDLMRQVTRTMADELDETTNLPVLSTKLFRMISQRTGNPDPFKAEKDDCNRIALPMANSLSGEILCIEDPMKKLESAILSSIAGNTMDLGTSGHSFDLSGFEMEYRRIVNEGLAIDDIPDLLRILKESETVIYLADNAGEIAFDKTLVRVISDLGPRVTVAVKGGPISNDATMEDARFVGMEEVATVITTGTDHLGVNFDESSDEFLQAFDSSDLVLGKGQSNLETLIYDRERLVQPVALVLRTKCEPIARALGARLGDNVLRAIRP